MNRNPKAILILFGAIAAVFLFAVLHLFELRFSAGDVYPPYSSFRADPLGVRALYGALGSLRGVSVRRNFDPDTQLGKGRDKTLLFCGASLGKDREDVIEAIEFFVAHGGRLVIAFLPVAGKPDIWFQRDKKDKQKKKQSGGDGEGEPAPGKQVEETSKEKEDPDDDEPVSDEEEKRASD